MKRIFVCTGMLLFLLTGCSGTTLTGSGIAAEKDFQLDGFQAVDVCCGMELYIQTGLPETVHIVADDNILDAMDVRVSANTLVVDFGASLGILEVLESQPMQIFVTLPELSRLEVSGGGAVTTDVVITDDFSMNLSGGSRAYLPGLIAEEIMIESSGGGASELRGLQTDNLTIDISGGGEITIYGTASRFDAKLSGGSELDGDGLLASEAILDIGGGGRNSLSVSKSLRVDLSGGSRLDYYGSPQIDRMDISSASELVGHSNP